MQHGSGRSPRSAHRQILGRTSFSVLVEQRTLEEVEVAVRTLELSWRAQVVLEGSSRPTLATS